MATAETRVFESEEEVTNPVVNSVRKSSRVSKLTPKALEQQQLEVKKRTDRFLGAYRSWQEKAREVRRGLKEYVPEPEVLKWIEEIEIARKDVESAYNDLRHKEAPPAEIRRQSDTCAGATQKLVNLLQERSYELEEDFDATTERRRLHTELDDGYARSLWGSTMSRAQNVYTSLSRHRPESDVLDEQASKRSISRSYRTGAEEALRHDLAELAAKKVSLQKADAIQAQRHVLETLQTERDIAVLEARISANSIDGSISENIDRRLDMSNMPDPVLNDQRAATHVQQEAPPIHPSYLRNDNASVQPAINVAYGNPAEPFLTSDAPQGVPLQFQGNPYQGFGHLPRHDTSFHAPRSTPGIDNPVNYENALAKAIQDSIAASRLPPTEPSVFTGDPLHFLEWQSSFLSLINKQGITPSERLHYLKRYIGGSARQVVEGMFFRNDHDAFTDAWSRLQDRYGDPFIVQRAFRDKLAKWPRVPPRNGQALRKFSDFLNACHDAMGHVDGLWILNDCEENQKLCQKLPEWVASRWNRQVTMTLDQGHRFPNFDTFCKFVATEARVACNPITSAQATRSSENERHPRDQKTDSQRGSARALATNTEVSKSKYSSKEGKGSSSSESPSKPPPRESRKYCSFCETEGHYLSCCSAFLDETLEKRKAFVQEKRKCFRCLRSGHSYNECRNRLRCEKCQKRHPTALHEDNHQSAKRAEVETQREEETAVALNMSSGTFASTSMVVPVWISVYGKSQERLVYALLDSQSDSTFIEESVRDALDPPVCDVRLKLTTMTGVNSVIKCQRASKLKVRGYNSQVSIDLPPAYCRDFIPLDRSHIPTSDTARRWDHLACIANEIPPLMDCEVGLLIGYNCSRALAPRQVITGKDNQPYAVKSDLGWSVVGSSTPESESTDITGFCHRIAIKELPAVCPSDALRMLESDFSESKPSDKSVSQDDIQFLQTLENGVSVNANGHLEMPLPFRIRPQLPNNKKLALTRLGHLEKKFAKNETYKEDYVKFMNDIIRDGDATKVDSKQGDDSVWYIPHHGVYHPKKPDKIRVVFDCSAKYGGTSLNDHLLTGPDLTNGLVGVLCRFRKHPIAIMCDVEKMFHRFHVVPDDRDFFRFLWWEDGNTKAKPSEFKMKVHLFGASSSPGCANYGLKHLAKSHEKDFPLGAQFLRRNFYVDDGITSATNATKAISLVKEAIELCAKGKLRLHKFISNDRSVINSIPQSERAAQVKELDLSLDKLPTERTLGIQWNVGEDVFIFSDKIKDQPLTRRGILSTVASIYDPLGFIAPFVLIGKGILQETCRNGVGWDDPLPDALRPRWEKWRTDVTNLSLIKIPRCYTPANFGDVITVELHHFSDASTMGYGQCSYVRFVNAEGEVHCQLVIGKARVAPTKIVTIPRLELSAAVVSAKVSEMLREELEFDNVKEYFWTDSRVVLGYINNDTRRFHTFVANRVQRIRESTTPGQWRYVPTDDNPADYASRGMLAAELAKSDWFNGPSFLWSKELVPIDETVHDLKLGDPEVRSTTVLHTQISDEPLANDIVERFSRFSSWRMAVNVMARILRIVTKAETSLLSVEEKQRATLSLIRLEQRNAFAEEIKLLLGRKSTLPETNKLHNLDPFLEDGVLRVGGRLKNAPIPDVAKHPALLPKGSHLTNLIVTHYHEKALHMGRGQTVSELRANGFWILGGSRYVADVIKQCVTCRKTRGSAVEQKMADFPEHRVSSSPPFTHVGMDCFGPFLVTTGRKTHKRYGLLFTCLYSRGIHIEMLDDMTTDAFINGLRCFIAIRGAVRTIRSDQGSNFVGARNELREALRELDEEALASYLSERQCDFTFNAPCASHAGGVWERQIRTVREVLSSTVAMCPRRLDDSSLRTLFYEAMALVNSRPLTTDAINDPTSLEPLTPNHLLTMKSVVPQSPPGKFVKQDMYSRRRWRRVQYLIEQFWHRWKKEYLSSVAIRQKWHLPRRNLKVDDIVLVADSDSPRGRWPLGRVQSTTVDSDGLVRKVLVHVGDRTIKGKSDPPSKRVLERPVQKLVLLVEKE